MGGGGRVWCIQPKIPARCEPVELKGPCQAPCMKDLAEKTGELIGVARRLDGDDAKAAFCVATVSCVPEKWNTPCGFPRRRIYAVNFMELFWYHRLHKQGATIKLDYPECCKIRCIGFFSRFAEAVGCGNTKNMKKQEPPDMARHEWVDAVRMMGTPGERGNGFYRNRKWVKNIVDGSVSVVCSKMGYTSTSKFDFNLMVTAFVDYFKEREKAGNNWNNDMMIKESWRLMFNVDETAGVRRTYLNEKEKKTQCPSDYKYECLTECNNMQARTSHSEKNLEGCMDRCHTKK